MLLQMEIALRERNGNFRLRQGVSDRNRDIALNLEPFIVASVQMRTSKLSASVPNSVMSICGVGFLAARKSAG